MTPRLLVLLTGAAVLTAGCAGQAGETPCERYAGGAGALAAEARQQHQDAGTPGGQPSGAPSGTPAPLDVPLGDAAQDELADALADCLAER